MGSIIELNDTLKIKESDFPKAIESGNIYCFSLPDRRIFHLYPVRVYLVKEVDDKWYYIGHAHILEQTINALTNTTSGKFKVSLIYPADYANLVNTFEPPNNKRP